MPTWKWKLRWPSLYPVIGIVILWHQTFMAHEAQAWLVFPALALMGVQIPINLLAALKTLQQHEQSIRENGDDHGPVEAQRR